MDDVAIVEEIVELLPDICKQLHSAIATDPQMAGLTIAQIKAVGFLYHNGEQTMTAMAAGLASSLPSASELVDRLFERGLIERIPDPADRRRVLVGLTPQSLTFARRLHDLRRIQIRSALQRIPSEEWPVLVRTLRAVSAALTECPIVDAGKDSAGIATS